MRAAVRGCRRAVRAGWRGASSTSSEAAGEAALASTIRQELESAMDKAADQRAKMRDALQAAAPSNAASGSAAAMSKIEATLLANNITPASQAFPPEAIAAIRAPEAVTQPERPRVCKAAVIGLENSGKSSLVNNVVGDHVSAVSFKSYTTRRWTLGVTEVGSAQVHMLDTPQLHAPLPQLTKSAAPPPKGGEEGMGGGRGGRGSPTGYVGVDQVFLTEATRRLMTTEAAWDSLYSADAVVVCIDAKYGALDGAVDAMLDGLSHRLNAIDHTPRVFAALTRLDAQADPLAAADELTNELVHTSPVRFDKIFPIQRTDPRSYLKLRTALAAAAVPAEWPYPQGTRTNQTPPEVLASTILEKALKHFPAVPKEGLSSKFLNVEVVGWTDRSDGQLQIDAIVTVASHKMRGIFLKNLSQITTECQKAGARHLQRGKLYFCYHVVEVPLQSYAWANPYGHYNAAWRLSDVDVRRLEAVPEV